MGQTKITFFIAIMSFLLSLYNFISALITHHKNVSVDIIEFNEFKFPDHYTYQLQIIVSNLSQLPISITSIKADDFMCKTKPSFVSETTRTKGGEVVSKENIKTIEFPINLSSLLSTVGYIEFSSPNKLSKTNLLLTLHTNRGTIRYLQPALNDE